MRTPLSPPYSLRTSRSKKHEFPLKSRCSRRSSWHFVASPQITARLNSFLNVMSSFLTTARCVFCAISIAIFARETQAQSVADSLFRRAKRLVAEGNGPAGRALVDSVLHGAAEGTPQYGDALYWR